MNKKKTRAIFYIALPFISIALLFSSCAGAGDQQMPKQHDNTAPGIQSNQITNTPVPSPVIKEAGFASGMYKIGQDMPAGEYKLFSTGGLAGISYFEIAKDSTNTLESIIANDNFFSFTYVTVTEEQYFKFTDARAVPAGDAEKSGPVDGKYSSGMYKVGVDIPAGEYKVLPNEDSTLGYGYFEITNSSRHAFDDIVSNDNFEDSRYVTLKDGQYLKLSEAHIDVGGT